MHLEWRVAVSAPTGMHLSQGQVQDCACLLWAPARRVRGTGVADGQAGSLEPSVPPICQWPRPGIPPARERRRRWWWLVRHAVPSINHNQGLTRASKQVGLANLPRPSVQRGSSVSPWLLLGNSGLTEDQPARRDDSLRPHACRQPINRTWSARAAEWHTVAAPHRFRPQAKAG